MSTTIGSIANNISQSYERLASGQRINSAKDDAAGLAILEKIHSQIDGLSQGSDNAADMKNALNTAEGGLSAINDSLTRIKELSVQAGNGIYTDEDRAMLQEEVSQQLDIIKDASKSTEFNTKKLLDGSFANQNTASNPSGLGMQISIDSASLKALGIDGYDLTTDFDPSRIDDAIDKVNASRAQIGAKSNALSSTINSNDITYLNMAAAKSRIGDADMAKEATELNKSKLLEQYQIAAQKRQQEEEKNKLTILQ